MLITRQLLLEFIDWFEFYHKNKQYELKHDDYGSYIEQPNGQIIRFIDWYAQMHIDSMNPTKGDLEGEKSDPTTGSNEMVM